MSFFKIVDARLSPFKTQMAKKIAKSKNPKLYNVKSIPLKIVQDKSIEVTPLININVTDLSKNGGKLYKNFHNGGDGGIKFKIDVIISKREKIRYLLYKLYKNTNYVEFAITGLLKEYYKNTVPLNVVTSAIDIPNGCYVISDNPTRKQEYTDYTVWTLEFTTFNALNVKLYEKNNNAIVLEALGKTNTKQKSENQQKLSKCSLDQLVFSKEKKVTDCVKYMQTELYYKGFMRKDKVDGWFGAETLQVVINYQRTIVKTYNNKKVNTNGKIDKETFRYLTGG